MSEEKQQWHLQWVHYDFGKELYASKDGSPLRLGKVDYDDSTVTVFMRCWRQVVGMPLIGRDSAEIVYDKTDEDPAGIIIDFLRSMLPAGVSFPPYLPDVDHRSKTAADAEPEPPDHGPVTAARRIYSELEVPLRFQVLLQMHDLLEWAENDVYGDWCDADSRFVLETMLRELDRR